MLLNEMLAKVILSIVITKSFCFASLAEEKRFAVKCRFRAVLLVRRRNKNHASDSHGSFHLRRKKALEEWKKKRKKKVIIGRGDVHDDEVASISVFICENCGYTVRSEPQGFYALKSEAYYNFRCKKCKNIVNISAEDIEEMGYVTTCPLCDEGRLSFWNPIEGHCPKCNGKMKMEKTT